LEILRNVFHALHFILFLINPQKHVGILVKKELIDVQKVNAAIVFFHAKLAHQPSLVSHVKEILPIHY
jgi:hypothetical protein